MRYEEMVKQIDREKTIALWFMIGSSISAVLLVSIGMLPFKWAVVAWAVLAGITALRFLFRAGMQEDLSMLGRRVLHLREGFGYTLLVLALFTGLFVRVAPDIIRHLAR